MKKCKGNRSDEFRAVERKDPSQDSTGPGMVQNQKIRTTFEFRGSHWSAEPDRIVLDTPRPGRRHEREPKFW